MLGTGPGLLLCSNITMETRCSYKINGVSFLTLANSFAFLSLSSWGSEEGSLVWEVS